MTGWRTAVWLLALGACSQRLEPVDTNDTGSDTGNDTGNHTGDTGGDTGDTSNFPFDCEAVAADWDAATPAPSETCIVQEIECGGVYEHSTESATSRLALADYDHLNASLEDRDGNYTGPDNTYLLVVPESETLVREISVVLESPCDDLYVLAWRVETDVCETEREPRQNASVDSDGWEQTAWWSVNRGGGAFAVVVDAHPGHAGPYRLSVECD